MIQVCHLLDHTLENRVGGVEFINHLLFQSNNTGKLKHQLKDAKSFNIVEPYSLIDHLQNKEFFDENSADVFHIHQIQPYGLKSLIKLAQKKPTILTIHDYYLFCQKSTFYREGKPLCEKSGPLKCTFCNFHSLKSLVLPLFFYFRSKLALQLLNQVRKIILPNKELLSLIPIQFHEKCITVHYATPKAQIKPILKKGFAYLGTLAPHKGVYQLIQTLKEVDFNDQLHIYSPNELQGTFPEFVKHCGLLTDKSKLSQYKALIIPSKWRETGPIVLQEALNANTEVILFNSPISSDYTQLNGVHQINDPQKILSFEPREFTLNTYSFEKQLESLESLYQSLCVEP